MKKFFYIFIPAIFILVSIAFVLSVTFYPKKYVNILDVYSDEYQISKSLIASVINVESSFKPDAVSSSGAMGLMQLKLATAQEIADKLDIAEFDLFDPEINIHFGCFYLRYLIDIYTDLSISLMCYNAGLNTVNSWMANPDYFDGEKFIYIPYDETRNYIQKIKTNLLVYNAKYNLNTTI